MAKERVSDDRIRLVLAEISDYRSSQPWRGELKACLEELQERRAADWPPRFRVDPEGGLRLVLTMLREQRITVDQAMECFSHETKIGPIGWLRSLGWDYNAENDSLVRAANNPLPPVEPARELTNGVGAQIEAGGSGRPYD
jgi:hypothetical protein